MNTLSDTDEGKARPSVWPVYVAAVTITILGLMCMAPQFRVLTAVEQYEFAAWIYTAFWAAAVFGLFGVVTGIGMLRLRPWGWLCGVVFAGVWAVHNGIALLVMTTAVSREGPELAPATNYVPFVAVNLVAGILLIVILATRRRLFFPRA